jgi:squalene synthase HpnC
MLTQLTRVPTVDEAFAHCRKIALGHYENFPVVSWLLPRDLRPHIYSIYAYCRGVDDLGDEADGDRLALLNDWEAQLDRCYAGTPYDIRFIALQETIRIFDIPREPFQRLIEANRRDQIVNRYHTFDDLLDYCSYSANPVGHLVLYVFGHRDAERQHLANAICTALQLTDILEDVSRDLAQSRIYIPLEDMEAFGCSEADVLARRHTEEFRRLMAFEIQRTRDLFREGSRLTALVRGRLRLYLRLFTLGGLSVLDAIERIDYDVLHRRPTVSRARKSWLALRGTLPIGIKAAR